MVISEITLVSGKDLEKGVDYWLTGDFYGLSRKKVRLHRKFPAKEAVPGMRGESSIVKTEDGVEVLVHGPQKVFATDPNND